LVPIGLVVSEEKIFEKVYDVRRTDGRTDGRRTPSDGKSSLGLWPGELKMQKNTFIALRCFLFIMSRGVLVKTRHFQLTSLCLVFK